MTEDYHIGPCYFINYDISKGTDSLAEEFELVIKPILSEYIRGRANEKQHKEFIDSCKKALTGKADNNDEKENE